MDTHVKVLSVIDVVLGALTLLAGFALLIAVFAGLAVVDEPAAVAAIAGIGMFVSLLVIAIGVLGIVVGIKLGERKNWARIAQIIFGAVHLVNFPVGTAFGVYSLWAMLGEEGRALFEPQPGQEEMHKAA